MLLSAGPRECKGEELAGSVQMALLADCALLYSEDLQDGRRFAGLRVVNPFRWESGAEPAGP
jgi:hypothetical protein